MSETKGTSCEHATKNETVEIELPDFIDIGIGSFDPTRPEFDPLEAITIEAIPLPRLVCWDGIIASDDFYEAPTGLTSSGQLRWASFGRMQRGM